MRFWKWSRPAFYLRALGYFRPDLSQIILLLATIGLATLLGLMQVWPMAILVDSVITPTPQAGWMSQWWPAAVADNRPLQIAILAGFTLILRLGQEVANMLRSLFSLRIGNGGLMRVRCELYRKLQALNVFYHWSQPQGDAIYRLSNDASGFQAILNVFIEVGVAACTLSIMLAIMFARSLELTLIALAIAPLLWVTNVWFGRILKSSTQSAKKVDSQFTSTVQRSISSIRLMQAFGREACEYGRFRNTVHSNLNAWFRLQWQFCCYRLCIGLIFGVGGALIFGCGAWFVYRDQFLLHRAGGMSIGDLMVFLTYLGMFYDPLCKLTGAGASAQEGMAGAERVFEVLDLDPGVHDAPNAQDLPRRPRTLTLAQVGFAYPSGNRVLSNVEVTIRPGEMVAFVGSSGVGKSTLLNLLPRFFDPTEGALYLDDYDLRQLKLRDLRQHVAVVLQESILLPTSVAENIAYGRPTATPDEIRAAANLACASEFIEALPDDYDSTVNEGGQNFSGGQRQRIAIARALLTEAPIIVLDEPTSALDPTCEQLVVETLRSLKGRRTIVLVSHRLSTVVDCDQICVMHDGQIVERGTHDELLALQGRYYEMAKHQLQLEAPLPTAA
jgi:ABC-type multidrug transport system fused ATPase/permease subunit